MAPTLTDVPGIRVGHAHDLGAATGCTVVLCPRSTRCAVDQRGGAPGTRETDLLGPGRLIEHVDAVLLSGGSAFGLAAADGVVAWLEERGRGFPMPEATVPIVPAAILYDLGVGRSDVRPGPARGRAACEAASAAPVAQGCVGAGAGCRVGAPLGPARATKGGIGSAGATLPGGAVVAALFAVNSFGDVAGENGRTIAGLRSEAEGERFASSLEWLLRDGSAAGSGTSTVIGVVATNARLSASDLALVATMAHDGIARAVRPSHTLFDGDTVFALSTGDVDAFPAAVGALAAEVTARAIRAGVLQATSLAGVRSCREA